MYFMYADGAEAHPPRTQNFLSEVNTLHRLFHVTMTPWIGDAIACPQYEWNLIQYYFERKHFNVFDYILSEILNIIVSHPKILNFEM
jgi:hypothetical protein